LKLKDIGEKGFIEEFIKKRKIVDEKYFLDVQLIEENLAVKVDGFPIKELLPFLDYFDVGWKAVISTLSDMFSLGVKPRFGLVSLGLDPEMELKNAELIFDGVVSACRRYNIELVGGDTNSGYWIDFFAIGSPTCKKIFNPNPKEGEYVILTNPIGYTSLVFYEFFTGKKLNLPVRYYARVKHPILNPAIVDVLANNCEYISYSSDISDGLLITLQNFHNLTKLSVMIEDLGFSKEVLEIAKSLSISISDLVKFSGEEFESIIVTSQKDKVIKDLEDVGFEPIIIGRVTMGEWKVDVHGWDNYKGWF